MSRASELRDDGADAAAPARMSFSQFPPSLVVTVRLLLLGCAVQFEEQIVLLQRIVALVLEVLIHQVHVLLVEALLLAARTEQAVDVAQEIALRLRSSPAAGPTGAGC